MHARHAARLSVPMGVRTAALLPALLASLLLAACGGLPDNTLALVGTDTVTVAEFERLYLDLRGGPPANDQEKQSFLRTLTDHRTRLAEARARGLDTDSAVVAEVTAYRDQLAVPYLLDRELVEPGVRVLYERRKDEAQAQHIVIRFRRGADGGIDTLSAWQRALDVLDSVRQSSRPFDSLVVHFSEDPGAHLSLGRTGWLVAGTTFPQLDDVLYGIPVGSIAPRPLRSGVGYHVLKLTGRRAARQRMHAAHIVYRLDINNPGDTAAAFAHLTLVRDSLLRGLATFEDLARRNSQDSASGAKGGDLGWLTRATTLESNFENALINLPVGQVSPVIRTPFGMHIIKMIEDAPAAPLDEMRDYLRQIYRRERFAKDFIDYTARLRAKQGFAVNRRVAERVIGRMDSGMTTSTPGWDRRLEAQDLDAYLSTSALGPGTVRDVTAFLRREPSLQMRPFTLVTMDTAAMLHADQRFLVHETEGFERTEPEFARLMTEYRESALVSRLEQLDMPDRLKPTDEDARAYWQQHRAEFRQKPQVGFFEIYAYNEAKLRAMRDSLSAGADFAALAGRQTERDGYQSRSGSWGFVPADQNELARIAFQHVPGEVVGPFPFQSGFSLIKVTGRVPEREMTWEEARSAVLTRLQSESRDVARARWTESLRVKHGVREFPENLKHSFLPPAEGK